MSLVSCHLESETSWGPQTRRSRTRWLYTALLRATRSPGLTKYPCLKQAPCPPPTTKLATRTIGCSGRFKTAWWMTVASLKIADQAAGSQTKAHSWTALCSAQGSTTTRPSIWVVACGAQHRRVFTHPHRGRTIRLWWKYRKIWTILSRAETIFEESMWKTNW